MRVNDFSSGTLNNRPHKPFYQSILLLNVRRKKLLDYICFFEIFSCQVWVEFAKISIKNANLNSVLSKNKYDKVLKNRRSLEFLLHEPDLDIICSFANKDNKIAKPPKCSIGLPSSAYISVQAKTRLRWIWSYVLMGLACHLGLNANFAKRWCLLKRLDNLHTCNHGRQLFNQHFI